LDETFLTFSFSPVRDAQGRVVGVTLAVVETTAKMLTERRTRLLRDIATATTGSVGAREALERAMGVLQHATFDVPFALAYAIEPGADEADLVRATPSTPDFAAPQRVGISADALPWPLARAVKSRRPELVTGLDSRHGTSTQAYPEAPATVLLLPLVLVGSTDPAAVLVAAVSARLRLDDEYLLFFERLAAAVATGVAGARAHEEQRRRAEELSALDRAKTAFFSNVSHEFRTPLTLLSGPLADELAECDGPLTGARRERLETAQRNAQRLIKLVNVLLDFSSLEAGKVSARYQPTQLGVLTEELASMFRSAIERAGLWLRVEVESSSDATFVDRDM
jgi:GAF domain-containing protein